MMLIESLPELTMYMNMLMAAFMKFSTRYAPSLYSKLPCNSPVWLNTRCYMALGYAACQVLGCVHDQAHWH